MGFYTFINKFNIFKTKSGRNKFAKPVFNFKGLSLIELLTTIVIMGILTTAAIPLGEVVFIRDKEKELKEILMTTRQAIDTFYAENNHYPRSFDDLRWFDSRNMTGPALKSKNPYGKPYLRKSPPINPFASSNQAWIVCLTNCTGGGVETMTLEQFNLEQGTSSNTGKEIYDIQFPSPGSSYFNYQINIYTSLEGTPYSTW